MVELITIEKSIIVKLSAFRRPQGQVSLFEVIDAVRSEYLFRQAPEGIPGPDQGLEFFNGEITSVPIAKLGIYNDGIVLQGAVSTEQIEECLGQFLLWAGSRFDVSFVETHEVSKVYESNVIVKANPGILNLNKKLSKLQKELQAELGSVSGFDQQFSVVSLTISPELHKIGGIKPSPFRIMRHSSADFSANLYQASAPLPTVTHLRMLELLEEISH